jgi:hypothetical protein
VGFHPEFIHSGAANGDLAYIGAASDGLMLVRFTAYGAVASATRARASGLVPAWDRA